VSTGSTAIPDCTTIVQTAIDKANTLMTQNANAGVSDVIYFFYPHLPPDAPGTLAGPTEEREVLPTAAPKHAVRA
jgi:hypothetical protein